MFYLVFSYPFSDALEKQRSFRFEKNQFFVVIMKSALEKGVQYIIKMVFRARLTNDLAGLYSSTYKRKDGAEV